MNTDQNAPWEQSDLGLYCWPYRLPKNREQTRKVMTGMLRVNSLMFAVETSHITGCLTEITMVIQ